MQPPSVENTSNPQHLLELHLNLREHGWSHALLFLPGEMKSYRLTHVFNDPMDEIGRASVAIAGGASESWFRWLDEPATHLFRLREMRNQKHMLTLSCWEEPGEISLDDKLPTREDMDWSVEVAKSHWIGLVCGELNKISMLARQPKYAEHRRPFPHQHAAALRQWCDKHLRSST